MFARRYQILGLQFYLHDLLLTVLAFLVSYILRNYAVTLLFPRLSHLYPIENYLPFLIGVLCLWTIIGHSLALYAKPDPGDRVQLIRDAAVLVVVGSIAVLAGLYCSRRPMSAAAMFSCSVLPTLSFWVLVARVFLLRVPGCASALSATAISL